jgi:ligand-binding SRPBCC domain-containing protein
MKPGALISYRLKLFGVPFRWLTEITVWEPNKRFIDTQLKGPYAKWEHEHTFSAEGGSTRMKDVVHYSPPGFFLAPLIQQLFLNKILNEVFRFRNEAIQRKFKPQELS